MANQSNGNPPDQSKQISDIRPTTTPFNRRSFLAGAAAGAATLAMPRWAHADATSFFSGTPVLAPALLEEDKSAIRAEITKRHDETVQRLQTWMKQPSIAAENRGMNEGCELTMQMLREAGFQQFLREHREAFGYRRVDGLAQVGRKDAALGLRLSN